MTGSLKRHPSEEADETPSSKRQEPLPPVSSDSNPVDSDAPNDPESTETTVLPGTSQQPRISITAPPESNVTTPLVPDQISSATVSLESAPTPPDTPPKDTPTAAVDPAKGVLSPPTNIGGVGIFGSRSAKECKVNGTENSILNSGFSLGGSSSFFSTGAVNGSSSTNIFAAALSSNTSSGGIFGSSTPGSGGFVFGANLTDRVLASSSSNDELTEEKKDETDDTNDSEDNASSSKTEQKALKEIEVSTGEEGEKVVMQVACKLYQFCPLSKSWIDRGAGNLKLNEKETEEMISSRIVFRSKAVMKVMLNSKVFASMIINRANLTTVRISAVDVHDGKFVTYLLRCSRNECDKLHTALLKRREIARQNREEFGEINSDSIASSSSHQEPSPASTVVPADTSPVAPADTSPVAPADTSPVAPADITKSRGTRSKGTPIPILSKQSPVAKKGAPETGSSLPEGSAEQEENEDLEKEEDLKVGESGKEGDLVAQEDDVPKDVTVEEEGHDVTVEKVDNPKDSLKGNQSVGIETVNGATCKDGSPKD